MVHLHLILPTNITSPLSQHCQRRGLQQHVRRDQALIQDHSWTTGDETSDTNSTLAVTCKIGLISYSEYNTYTTNSNNYFGIISNLSNWWWTRTPSSSGSGVAWGVVPGGGLGFAYAFATIAVRPALYLNPDISISLTPGGDLSVVPGRGETGQSSVTASSPSAPADGSATSTITVALKDANGSALSGKTVQLVPSSRNSAIKPVGGSAGAPGTPVSGTTDGNGKVQFAVTDTTAEAVTYTATDMTDAITQPGTGTSEYIQVTQAAQVQFNPVAPVISGAYADGTFYATITNPNSPSVDQSVYYTTDGNDTFNTGVPSGSDVHWYQGQFQLALPVGATTVNAAVYDSDTGGWSPLGTATYTGQTITPSGETHTGPLTVKIDDQSLAVWQSVYYSTTGDPETFSHSYAYPLPYNLDVPVSETVYARVYDYNTGWENPLVSETYTIQTPAPVINSPVYSNETSVGGTAADNATVTLYDNGTPVGKAAVIGSGEWTVGGLTLTAGDSLTATAQVSGQQVSVLSSAVTVNGIFGACQHR